MAKRVTISPNFSEVYQFVGDKGIARDIGRDNYRSILSKSFKCQLNS